MPYFRVCLDAETEGVVAIRPVRPRIWGLKFDCGSCRETSPHFVYVDEREERDSGGGGTRNAVFKCAFCKAVLTATIDTESYGKYTPGGDGGVLLIEVRGASPAELELDNQWVVEAEGSAFERVDLSEDWVDYDEASGAPASVSGVSVRFERAKGTKHG
ncbi:hypothetical protein TraAM80_09005 [Trypanosoma rangeli]|uniref:Uncharacterized protein n=1 Tax=Trypanosoma rangeli TaxID=5698 RepID=A0A422MXW1_TRYRA|nr:uncharacterized protein TraAM80_09005 [Trypanosoma rangeli]RNE98037.1 hypothetical protein TraAM80_09005 [Trypanosoma rangeli]|eukprot:RNE98037.1 hypothetical protein TraAM80_09005 [Trypanosoma rangeli]